MRRGRFGGIADDNAERIHALSSIQILFFDLLSRDDSDMERMASERIRMLSFAGPYLAAAHLICAAILLTLEIQGSAQMDMLGPLTGVIVIAFLPYLLLNRQRTINIRPHVVARFWAAFIGAISLAWFFVIASDLGSSDGQVPAIAYGALAGAFGLTIAAFLSIPSLLLASYISATIAFMLVSPNSTLFPLFFIFGGCLLGASLFSSRDALIAAGRKLTWETEARKASRLLAGFENSGHGWFWETDAEGVLTYASSALAQQLKVAPDDLIGQQFQRFVSDGKSDTSGAGERSFSFHLSTKLPFSELSVQAINADDIWWSVSGTPHFDDYGRFLGFSGMATDLSDKRRVEAEAQHLARFDTLTGLPNRTLMRMTLEDSLRNIDKQRKGCALFLIDLDRFKNVNDTLGHPVGDALLKQVADRLRTVVGSNGQVGRIGGDEFQAVFPSSDEEGWLGLIAAQLIQQLSMPYLIEGNDISIGASVGIAIARVSAQCPDDLIRDADIALYAAKNDGRGTCKLFEPEMHSEAKDRQLLEDDLRQALQRGQLQLEYQPIVHAISEEVVGFEALCRWHHPTRGQVPTDRFIALAEETGLIVPIGEWILRQACADASEWPDSVRIAVNVSPVQFVANKFVDSVHRALVASELASDRLEIEITESVFLSGGEIVEGIFGALKGAGVRLALDDFGTGYSSLGYLKKAPFNKIKIDQSFVRGAANGNDKNIAILRAIVSLAATLGMDTTAEGVETHDDLNLVRELGCSQVQGYIFARPMDAQMARELAATSKALAAEGFATTREPRTRLLRRGSLQWNGMTFPVRLKNISTGGALIDSDRKVEPGSQVQLDLPGIGNFGAEIRWSDGSLLGIQFEKPFQRSKLSAMQAEFAPKGVKMVQPTYLQTYKSPTSPWAARTERLTPDELKRKA